MVKKKFPILRSKIVKFKIGWVSLLTNDRCSLIQAKRSSVFLVCLVRINVHQSLLIPAADFLGSISTTKIEFDPVFLSVRPYVVNPNLE